MDRGAEIVTLYAPPRPRRRSKKSNRATWGAVLLGGFIWSARAAIALLAGMQLRELLGL